MCVEVAKPLPHTTISSLHKIYHQRFTNFYERHPKRNQELKFILLVGLMGMVVDSLKKITGLITYAGDVPVAWLAPPWIIAMWLLFSTSLNGSLSWLKDRYGLAVILGAIFGPLSYVSGARLGAASFNDDLWVTLGVVAVVWGLVVPGIVWLSEKMVDC